MTFGMHGWAALARRARALGVVCIVLAAIAACEPGAPPGFTATPPTTTSAGPGASASAAQGSAPVAGKPVLTMDGTTVRVVGLGNGVTPDFELPAGSAAMTVSVCSSNQVIPFVTLYDAKDTKLGMVVEPEYDLTNLVGGAYYLDVATNPSCIWTIEIKPK